MGRTASCSSCGGRGSAPTRSTATRARAPGSALCADFKENRNSILVATDIAARGIDVDGISHVFNYDLPHEPETYIHRIGRTGRAGATGIAVSFCDEGERSQLRAIERLIRRRLPVDPESLGGNGSEQFETPAPHGHRHFRPRTSAGGGGRRAGGGRRRAGGGRQMASSRPHVAK